MSKETTAILIQSATPDIPWKEFRVDFSAADVIALLYRFTDAQWLNAWDEHVGTRPASMTVLATRTTTRRDASDASTRPDETPGLTVTEITPENLTQTGTQITDTLRRIGESDHPLLVYCDSVTTLLQFSDFQTTYRFFHTLRGHVNAAGGTLYVQINPAAHDEKSLHTLTQLFDTSIEL